MLSNSTTTNRRPHRSQRPEQVELRGYLENQLNLGFQPRYMISYHFRSPEETCWRGKEQPNAIATQARHRPRTSTWNQVGSYHYYQKRRNNPDLASTDNEHIKNLLIRRHFGHQRLDQWNKTKLPPMLFFLERGMGVQLHGHLLIPQPLPEFDAHQSLAAEWKGYLPQHAKCLSRQRPADVRPVTDAAGIMGYLCKETSSGHVSLDFIASNLIKPAS